MSDDAVRFFAKSLLEAKEKLKYCNICGNFTDNDICPICAKRESKVICVVKEPKDVLAMEKAHRQRI